MNIRQRLTVLAALVVAIMLTPAVALAQNAPTLADLTSQTASATADFTKAQAHLQDLDAQLATAREKLSKVESAVPSTPGEDVRAAATAIAGVLSPSLAKQADKTASDIRERDELRTQIDKLQKEREQTAAEVEKTKKQAADLQTQLDAAKKAAAQAAAEEAERIRAQIAPSIRLMIDPGHGGHDPGAVGNGLYEKDVNLAISLRVVAAAQRQGWNVGLTRDADYFVPLDARPGSAISWGATDFVAIHSNSMDASPHGNMTIYRTAEGAALAQNIMQQLDPLTPYPDMGAVPDVRGLAVLRGATMPATLVEVMSLSSPDEAAALANPDVQTAYAEAIVKGVAAYHGIAYVPPAAAQPAAAQPAAPAAQPAPPKAAPAASKTPEAATPSTAETPQPRENKLLEQFLLLLSK